MAASHTILYIDDEPQLPTGFEEELRAAGYRLLHTDDPDEALTMVRVEEIDLVLAEIVLSACNGIALLDEMRSYGGWPAEVPVIVVTKSERTPDLYGDVLGLGVQEFFTKPVPAAELLESIRQFTGKVLEAGDVDPSQGSSAPENEASLSGDLARTPISEVLRQLQHDAASGVLTVTRGRDRKAFELRNGSPVLTSANGRVEELVEFLARHGRIEPKQLRTVKERSAAGEDNSNQILLDMGTLSEEEFETAIREQAEELLLDVFRWDWGDFHYFPGKHVRADVAFEIERGRIEIVLDGVRHWAPPELVEEELASRASLFVSKVDDPPCDVAELDMSSAERVFFESLYGDRSVQEVIDSGELAPATLYGLFAAGLLVLDEYPVTVLTEVVEVQPEPPVVPEPPNEELVAGAASQTAFEAPSNFNERERSPQAETQRPVDQSAAVSQSAYEAMLEFEELEFPQQPVAARTTAAPQVAPEDEALFDALSDFEEPAPSPQPEEPQPELDVIPDDGELFDASPDFEEPARSQQTPIVEPRIGRDDEMEFDSFSDLDGVERLPQMDAESSSTEPESARNEQAGFDASMDFDEAERPTPTEAAAAARGSEPEPEPPVAPVVSTPFTNEELTAFCERVLEEDDFDALGISDDATDTEVQSAYQNLLDRFPPDLAATGLSEVEELADKARKRIERAFERLRLGSSRKVYAQLRPQIVKGRKKATKPQAAEPAPIDKQPQFEELAARGLDAEAWFHKGDRCMHAKDYAEAIGAYGMAAHLDPKEGDYLARLGYAQFLNSPKDPLVLREALQNIATGIKLCPNREKPYIYLGKIFQQNGANDRARKMFKNAVRINPNCHEAAQALHLMKQRRTDDGKLFNRLKKILN